MKKKLLFILLLFISTLSYSQQYHRAKTFSFTIERNDKWTPWSRKEIINADIKIDSAKKIINIYTNRPQIYTIHEAYRFVNEEQIFYLYYCEDEDGVTCIIDFSLDRNGYNKSELEIKYTNLKVKYELK